MILRNEKNESSERTGMLCAFVSHVVSTRVSTEEDSAQFNKRRTHTYVPTHTIWCALDDRRHTAEITSAHFALACPTRRPSCSVRIICSCSHRPRRSSDSNDLNQWKLRPYPRRSNHGHARRHDSTQCRRSRTRRARKRGSGVESSHRRFRVELRCSEYERHLRSVF
jgi:hypothetical protein